MTAIVNGLTSFISLGTFTSLLTMFAPYVVGAIAFGFVVNILRSIVRIGRKRENVY